MLFILSYRPVQFLGDSIVHLLREPLASLVNTSRVFPIFGGYVTDEKWFVEKWTHEPNQERRVDDHVRHFFRDFSPKRYSASERAFSTCAFLVHFEDCLLY